MFLTMTRVKELSNSQKDLIVKLWKDGDSYRNISSNLNIPFPPISSFIARFKRRKQFKTKQNKTKQKKIKIKKLVVQGSFLLDYQDNPEQNPMVKRDELQEDLRSSGCSVTKRTLT